MSFLLLAWSDHEADRQHQTLFNIRALRITTTEDVVSRRSLHCRRLDHAAIWLVGFVDGTAQSPLPGNEDQPASNSLIDWRLQGFLLPSRMRDLPELQAQEIPLEDLSCRYSFLPSSEKPFVATRAAIELYGIRTLLACLLILQDEADRHQGLHKARSFRQVGVPQALWFIDDGPRGAITALLASDY